MQNDINLIDFYLLGTTKITLKYIICFITYLIMVNCCKTKLELVRLVI